MVGAPDDGAGGDDESTDAGPIQQIDIQQFYIIVEINT